MPRSIRVEPIRVDLHVHLPEQFNAAELQALVEQLRARNDVLEQTVQRLQPGEASRATTRSTPQE